ncbi:1620_t:CDS:2 [Rhizophagus irregularis]|nr:1620_t:CDS:2 [Rhizophagus irregularis]
MPATKARNLHSHITLFLWKTIKLCSAAKRKKCIANDVINIFGNLFTFHIKLFSDENNSQPVNAFDILKNVKNAIKERHLPIFDFSQSGWSYDAIPIGKRFVRELSDALWHIDKCGHKTLTYNTNGIFSICWSI